MFKIYNLLPTVLISSISATIFILLNKHHGKIPKAFKVSLIYLTKFKKYISDLFKFENVFDNRMKNSFDNNMHTLYSFLGNKDFKYKLPFIMIMGAEKSGKSSIINSLKLERTIDDLVEKNEFCDWFFFNDAVLLEMNSALFSSGEAYVSSDDSNWNKLLHLLSYHRPERPIDSLILTISMNDILDESMNLSNIAEHYYIKLWNMQKKFGVNIPIYIVITHTDLIPGFAHFANSLEYKLQNEMFGWSNPNYISGIEDIQFIENAIDQVIDRLLVLQQEIMISQIESPGGLFAFPFEMHKLRSKISEFLYYIFKRNSLHDSFMLRGIYFVGSARKNAYASHEFSQSLKSVEFGSIMHHSDFEAADDILFINNLFVDKIFKEKSIASSLSRRILDNSNKVRILQYLFMIMCLGGVVSLSHFYSRIYRTKSDFRQGVERIRLAVHNAKLVYKGTYDELDNSILEDQSLSLINAMNNINADGLFSYFLPPSWFSSLRYDINFMLGSACDVILFKFIASKFNLDLRNAIAGKVSFKNDNKKAFDPFVSDEFVEFYEYVKQVVKLENIYNKIQRIPYLHNIDDVAYVMKNLLNLDASHNLKKNKRIFSNVLKYAKFNINSIESYKKEIIFKAEYMFDKFINNALQYEKIIPNIVYIQTTLKKIEDKQNYDTEKLNSYFNDLASSFNNKKLMWVSEEKLGFNDNLNNMIYRIQDSHVLGPKVAHKMKKRISSRIISLKERMLTHRIPIIGSIFHKNENGVMLFSKNFSEFQGVLNLLAGKSFMKYRKVEMNYAIKDSLVKWNLNKLANIAKMIDEFRRFTDHNMLYQHEKATNAMSIVACNSIMKNISYTLSNSQTQFDTFDKEDALLSNISQNFKEAQKYLTKILDFIRFRNAVLFADLKNAIQKQSIKFIEKMNHMLVNKDLYNIAKSDFYFDENIRKADVEEYLVKQNEQITYLSELSEPAVRLLSKVSDMGQKIYSPTFLEWKTINESVEKNREGKANQIKSIEKFIKTYVLDRKDCSEILDIESSSNQDYFDRKKMDIISSIGNKCLFDNYNTVKVQYRKIRSYFNKYMAHRFPFNKKSNVEVTPEEARNFLAIWREKNMNIDLLSRYLKHKYTWAMFLYKMNSIIPWLESMSDIKKYPGSFLITLRTNRENEKLGDHLAIWNMKFGNQEVSMNMDPKEIELGNYDFSNTMKISKESNYAFEKGGSCEMKYKGFFGIIRLIDKFCAKNCNKGKKLKMKIPLRCGKELVVWCDVELKGNLMDWPNFPSYAAEFPAGEARLCSK
ncbi:hypothetical protein FZC35_02530 [Candidatus Cytomitobacter indipagum]|uniref:Type VI secretion system component TssM1 N-terminal domain-containing protein n=1 Tax=Candidatus Cytomitobacter indipagum TaxID=2601575 RepID=A0A5C0UDX9_9PROT|nr:type VI secretion system protein [Candidatus Cytomitobacter indipagum]QEK38228.1 hypothetical protein FZC35_02530 [Candidatus Cytomitobacter indipagum]